MAGRHVNVGQADLYVRHWEGRVFGRASGSEGEVQHGEGGTGWKAIRGGRVVERVAVPPLESEGVACGVAVCLLALAHELGCEQELAERVDAVLDGDGIPDLKAHPRVRRARTRHLTSSSSTTSPTSTTSHEAKSTVGATFLAVTTHFSTKAGTEAPATPGCSRQARPRTHPLNEGRDQKPRQHTSHMEP